MDEYVSEKTCKVTHDAIEKENFRTETRLNAHSERIDSMQEAIIKLTTLVDSIGKKSVYDKILTISVFIIAVVLLAVILGPEYVGKILGGM
jgi:DNA-binding protein H-NS